MFEGQICICCMSTDDLCDLDTDGFAKNYAKILRSCFSLKITKLDGANNILCNSCITKLIECVKFKKQVLTTLSILTSKNVYSLVRTREDVDILDMIDKSTNQEDLGTEDLGVEEHDVELKTNSDDVDDKDFEENVSNKRHLRLTRQGRKKKRRGRPRIHQKVELPPLDPEDPTCKECGHTFDNIHVLRRHYNTHFRNYVCQMCDSGFANHSSLQKHYLTHKAGPFVCPVCQKEFASMNTMLSHKWYKHNKCARLVFRCARCPERFTSGVRRARHMASAHGLADQYRCAQCAATFSTSSERSKHVQNVHEAVVYACPLCPYKSRKQYLKAHLANKHFVGDKEYECSHCLKRFCRKMTLKEHMRIHLNDYRFICLICQKKFIQKCSLKSHLQTHLKKKQCDDIDKLMNDPKTVLDPSEYVYNITKCQQTVNQEQEQFIIDTINNGIVEEKPKTLKYALRVLKKDSGGNYEDNIVLNFEDGFMGEFITQTDSNELEEVMLDNAETNDIDQCEDYEELNDVDQALDDNVDDDNINNQCDDYEVLKDAQLEEDKLTEDDVHRLNSDEGMFMHDEQHLDDEELEDDHDETGQLVNDECDDELINDDGENVVDNASIQLVQNEHSKTADIYYNVIQSENSNYYENTDADQEKIVEDPLDDSAEERGEDNEEHRSYSEFFFLDM